MLVDMSAGLKMCEPNPTHFIVNHIFCNLAQFMTGWLVKWIGLPIHTKKNIYLFIYLYLNI